MGSFSWTRADIKTKRSNLTDGDRYKILIPIEFGGGYIKDIYWDYGEVFHYACDNVDYIEYVDSNNKHHNFHNTFSGFTESVDLYGILAYWNKCTDMIYYSPTYPNNMIDIILYGNTDNQNNRCKGINIGCYDAEIDGLKYPLKLVSPSYTGTYEECNMRSYGDPNQGFFKGYWNRNPYRERMSFHGKE